MLNWAVAPAAKHQSWRHSVIYHATWWVTRIQVGLCWLPAFKAGSGQGKGCWAAVKDIESGQDKRTESQGWKVPPIYDKTCSTTKIATWWSHFSRYYYVASDFNPTGLRVPWIVPVRFLVGSLWAASTGAWFWIASPFERMAERRERLKVVLG